MDVIAYANLFLCMLDAGCKAQIVESLCAPTHYLPFRNTVIFAVKLIRENWNFTHSNDEQIVEIAVLKHKGYHSSSTKRVLD